MCYISHEGHQPDCIFLAYQAGRLVLHQLDAHEARIWSDCPIQARWQRKIIPVTIVHRRVIAILKGKSYWTLTASNSRPNAHRLSIAIELLARPIFSRYIISVLEIFQEVPARVFIGFQNFQKISKPIFILLLFSLVFFFVSSFFFPKTRKTSKKVSVFKSYSHIKKSLHFS